MQCAEAGDVLQPVRLLRCHFGSLQLCLLRPALLELIGCFDKVCLVPGDDDDGGDHLSVGMSRGDARIASNGNKPGSREWSERKEGGEGEGQANEEKGVRNRYLVNLK
jgi:hypothetical protein